jgi:hypothetical protein
MITKTTVTEYGTADGKSFKLLSQAQAHDLKTILEINDATAEAILDNRAQIVDILTTTETSKPRARKVNGGTKTKKTPTPAA